MSWKSVTLGLLTAVTVVSCNEPFAPKGPFEDKLVVYAILTNAADTQYVRVFKTYDPPRYDPYEVVLDQPVRGADVSVTEGSSVIRYQEGLTKRAETSRYKDDIVAYLAFPFRAQAGNSYDLSVVSQQFGTVRSSVSVPGSGWVELVNSYIFFGQGSDKEPFVARGYIRGATRGFLIRFYLDYEYAEGGTWVQRREEMATRVSVFGDNLKVYEYPRLARRTSPAGSPGSLAYERAVFSREAYQEKLNDLGAQHPSLRLVGALLILTQVEPNLYTYYNLANGFQDEYSIRQDLPDWSNIMGGYGVFGAMVEDSAYISLRR